MCDSSVSVCVCVCGRAGCVSRLNHGDEVLLEETTNNTGRVTFTVSELALAYMLSGAEERGEQ